MAAFNPTVIMDALQSKLDASGFVKGEIAEPKAAPENRTAFVIWEGAGLDTTHGSLSKGSGMVTFLLRFMWIAFTESAEKAEKDIAIATLQLMFDLMGDYDLGDVNARNIQPNELTARAGYLEVGGTMYRISDLTVQILINDMVDFSK